MASRVTADRSRGGAALELRHVSKRFRGQRALADVDLDVRSGEVHALLGVNGSGKSTLIKILAGYHQPEAGAEGSLYGHDFPLGSASAAAEGGVRFVHQDLGLIANLTVGENLGLGVGHGSRWWTSGRRERAAAARLLEEFELDIDPGQHVRSLGTAHQTMVAIVRALRGRRDARTLLVLDESTASLPEHEVAQLFGLVRRIRGAGGSVLYVTHRLGEVSEIADRVTVLRDGRRVATRSVEGLSHADMVQLVVGREVEAIAPAQEIERREAVLTVDGLGGVAVRDVSMTVHRGEILGVTGLVGSGYEQVPGLIFGALPRTAGTVAVDGRPIRGGSPRESVRAGLAFTPADRKRDAGLMAWTLRENITLPRLKAARASRWLSARQERSEASTWLERLEVKPPYPEASFSALSGGNQQKVVLARWLRTQAKVFIFDQPTVGVDVGARRGIYESVIRAAEAGAGVVVTSSEAEELCALCHRILVMRNGRVTASLDAGEATPERIIRESLGATLQHETA